MKNSSIMENLIDNIYDSVIFIEQDGTITLCNKSFEQLIGVSREDILNEKYYKLFKNQSLILEFIEKEESDEMEINIREKHLFLKKICCKSDEIFLGNFLIFRDVTTQKNSKHQLDKLKESLGMIEELLDNAYYGMVLVDEEGKIVKWNYEKLMGIKEKDVLGKYVQDVIENTRLHIVAKTGQKELCDVQRVGDKHIVTSRIPIIKDGKIIGAAGTVLFKDLKELKSLAQRLELLENTLHKYKGELSKMYKARYSFDDIISRNRQMIELKEMARRVAQTNSTILIQGESGTGKELFAHAIHMSSLRKYGTFITINCAAIPRELLEAELFGYEEGAFTGAKREGKIGKFELANGGTILLDEIGCMPLEMQSKLLRVLESREFERIGGNNRINLDVRIIASTNEDLEKAIEGGSFRRDLYYRLNVIKIEIPPLRERKEDIPLLANSIIKNLSKYLNIENKVLTKESIEILKNHNWPGNVRELRNVIERAMNLASGAVIYPENLPEYLRKDTIFSYESKEKSMLLKDVVANAEIEAILRVLEECEGNRTLAAEKLGIHRTALYKKIEKYKLKV